MKDRKLRAGIALEEVPHLPPVSPLPGVRDLRDEAPGLWTETLVAEFISHKKCTLSVL